jgi:hypothetical protein
METQPINIDKATARELYQQYREHQHFSTPIDREIQKAYRLISQGRVVIQAFASIVAAGLNEQRLPKLAISRATDKECNLSTRSDGWARFASEHYLKWNESRRKIEFPEGSFPGIYTPTRETGWRSYSALVPLVPIHLRPKTALDEYHILFEAEWRRVVPRDPMLLRRIGNADLWLVVAAWDLTDVEVAALSTRVSVHRTVGEMG